MSFNIQWYSSLNSTNQEMKKELTRNNELKNYSIISTYNQTNGVGRFNRKWVSTYNANLCFSIFIKSNTDIKNIDNTKYPKEGSIIQHMYYLSLCQFTSQEMASGWAFKVVNQLQGDQKPNNFKLGPHTATLY